MNARLNIRIVSQLQALILIVALGLMALGCAQPGEAPEAAAKPEVAVETTEADLKAVAPAKAPPAAEAEAAKPARLVFGEIDKDGDGFLVKEELHSYLFARMDANSDGKVTQEEQQAYRDGGHYGHGHGDGHGHGHKQGGCPHAADKAPAGECPHAAAKAGCDCPDCQGCSEKGECTCPKCKDCSLCQKKVEVEGGCGCGGGHSFKTCDANSDGSVTIDECKKGEHVLAKLDADKDGKVSKEEFEAHKKPHGHGHGGCAHHSPSPATN